MVDSQFILLRDFPHAYDSFLRKLIDIDDRLSLDVRIPLERALAACVADLKIFDIGDLYAHTQQFADGSYFVVTMDGGVGFPFADYRLELTRTAFTLSSVYRGPYIRCPRGGNRQFIEQGFSLERLYRETGNSRPILLCDDGIGTGDSLRRVVHMLSEHRGLPSVSLIAVFVNPAGLRDIDGVPVETLLPDSLGDPLWLNERDFYWGLPRSGVSFAPRGFDAVGGVPYSLDLRLVEERIGLKGEAAVAFRQACLSTNIEFWRYLERGHNQNLVLRDCDRLRFLGERFGGDHVRIVDAIELARQPGFSLVEP